MKFLRITLSTLTILSLLAACDSLPEPSSDTPDDGTLLGALDSAEIDEVIGAALPDLRRCYQHTLNQGSSADGTLVAKLLIENDGSTVASMIDAGAFEDDFLACLEERLEKLTFPEPRGGGIVIVRYPFSFSSE